jgi:uncharacterized delta-60 repeat protein
LRIATDKPPFVLYHLNLNKMKIKNYLLLTSLILMGLLNANAQDGTLDPSFAPVTGADNGIQRIALQNDGKIIGVGSFTTYDGVSRKGIVRINTDGTLDPSFDPGAGIFIEWGQYARAVALQADGKILMGGTFTNYNFNYTNHIARINTDGSYDPSLSADNVTGFGINGEVDVIKVQPDGKILVGGPFSGSGSFMSKNIVRLNTDGTADTTFVSGDPNSGTGPSGVGDMALQPDGKIVIVGSFTHLGTTLVGHIARLNPDGSADNTFNAGTGADNAISAITLLADGKMIISGWFHSINGVLRWNIARLNSDGSLDTTFVPNLPQTPSTNINCHDVQQDGKIVAAANWTRLYHDGPMDTTSWHNGATAGGNLYDILIQPDGKILYSGAFMTFDGTPRQGILRLNGTPVAVSIENTQASDVAVYPNPFQSQTVLNADFPLHKTTLTIVNSMGQIVKQIKPNSGNSITIHRDNLPSGLYFIHLTENGRETLAKKIVITD